MIVIEDTRQKDKQHNQAITNYMQSQGIGIVRSKLLTGDYTVANRSNVAVDSKQNLEELYKDLIQDHDRFSRECQLATKCGIELFIVIPSNTVRSIDDIVKWENPQLRIYHYRKAQGQHVASKGPVENKTLCKIMHTMETRYNVKFVFVPEQAVPEVVTELLLSKPI